MPRVKKIKKIQIASVAFYADDESVNITCIGRDEPKEPPLKSKNVACSDSDRTSACELSDNEDCFEDDDDDEDYVPSTDGSVFGDTTPKVPKSEVVGSDSEGDESTDGSLLVGDSTPLVPKSEIEEQDAEDDDKSTGGSLFGDNTPLVPKSEVRESNSEDDESTDESAFGENTPLVPKSEVRESEPEEDDYVNYHSTEDVTCGPEQDRTCHREMLNSHIKQLTSQVRSACKMNDASATVSESIISSKEKEVVKSCGYTSVDSGVTNRTLSVPKTEIKDSEDDSLNDYLNNEDAFYSNVNLDNDQQCDTASQSEVPIDNMKTEGEVKTEDDTNERIENDVQLERQLVMGTRVLNFNAVGQGTENNNSGITSTQQNGPQSRPQISQDVGCNRKVVRIIGKSLVIRNGQLHSRVISGTNGSSPRRVMILKAADIRKQLVNQKGGATVTQSSGVTAVNRRIIGTASNQAVLPVSHIPPINHASLHNVHGVGRPIPITHSGTLRQIGGVEAVNRSRIGTASNQTDFPVPHISPISHAYVHNVHGVGRPISSTHFEGTHSGTPRRIGGVAAVNHSRIGTASNQAVFPVPHISPIKHGSAHNVHGVGRPISNTHSEGTHSGTPCQHCIREYNQSTDREEMPVRSKARKSRPVIIHSQQVHSHLEEGPRVVTGHVFGRTMPKKKSNENRPVKKNKTVQVFFCNCCSRAFISKKAKIAHERMNRKTGPFKCSVCDKTFKLEYSKKVHERCHTDVRPYECSVCNKTFKTHNSLSNHKVVHSTERRFPCSFCQKLFKTRNCRKIHEITHADKVIQCSFCPRTFRNDDYRKRHEMVHTNDRPYKCPHCPKAFTRPAALNIHLVCHSNLRNIHCRFCDKSFNRKEHCQRHEKIHLNDKQYQCQYCPKRFITAWKCKRHEQVHERKMAEATDSSDDE